MSKENSQKIKAKIDAVSQELKELALSLHSHPELAFHEFFACDNLIKILEKYGYHVQKGAAGLETAFVGEKRGREGGPTVAILAEYDALPMGHACGHNLIATMSMGAAIGIGEVIENLCGRILVIGTPAEEGGGGKVIMCDRGVFRDVDFAMMIHPAKRNMVQRGGLAVKQVKIEYFGKPAHGTRPEEGINALSAVIQTFNLMDAQRALLPLKSSVNGYIIEGGTASNVIPEYASCEFCIRGDKVKDLLVVEKALNRAIETVNTLFGTTAKTQSDLMYTERYSNRMMDETFRRHLEEMGETVEYPSPTMKYGSSDIGNVSLEVPTIQPYLKIGEADTHTHGFMEAAKSPHGLDQAIKGAKALALTACDILESPQLQQEIKEEFKRTVPSYTREELGYDS
ncbi:MAG TPA: amidohydrolase [Candidatus Enterocloster faecavium]|mgnify:FL=1|uniref:Peptidase M20 domain-containing protein 2 n=1 Tax=Candidatus Enterocloster faecavium TaxID=2838560 RepID=A0A9D2RJA1_9FIRM|nr:amidohydrolase [Candidatus Enterocloster faecavium]